MKHSFHSRTPQMLAAALALTLGLSTGAFAEPPRGSDRHRHGGHGIPHKYGHGHGAPHGGLGFGFSQRLHDELKLDARQEALWQEAHKFAKDSFDGKRERFRKHHDEIAALLNRPDADLRAIARRMDELRAEAQKQRDAVRERWLSVYDALSPGQKEKVRLFLKERVERPGRGFDRPGRRDGGNPGDRGGWGAQPPMERTTPAPAQN